MNRYILLLSITLLTACTNHNEALIHSIKHKEGLDAVMIHLKAGADPNKAMISMTPALTLAIEYENNLDVIQALIDAGSNINEFGFNEVTPLFKASGQYQDTELVDLLIRNGADPSFTGYSGFTPIHSVINNNGDVSIIEQLLNAGADINSRDYHGVTALMKAIIKSKENEEDYHKTISYLIDKGADVNLLDHLVGHNALFYGVIHSLNPITLNLLIDAGIDRALVDKSGMTVFHTTLKYKPKKDLPYIQQIYSLGYNINQKDGHGNTPLMTAIKMQYDIQIIEWLLRTGADPNIADEKGRTVLMEAISQNYGIELYESLLHAGSDINALDLNGDGALMESIEQYGLDRELHKIEFLLNSGVLVDAVDKRGFSALHLVMEDLQSAKILPLLLNKGADVNLQNKYGNSPLMHLFICRVLNSAISEMSLDLALDLHQTYNNEMTMSLFLDFLGDSEDIDPLLLYTYLLLEAGADPNLVNNEGMTAIMILSEIDDPDDLIKSLLLGADAG
jgi:ankyrin repeat protein